ncbi:STAS-like domain-containing protein [Rhizobium sp. BE258]|uniref:STAS-like domain-containing protein n=1 Tax=Rhizobium sp. BE258 TaxID=2817722 RepID=UPI00285D1DA3|nr:STAS-like domain-containing protein [Rhizobium sp. BE258]MDR7146173.1 hypothetical protein [Rhizobium sp. BE258]
MQIDLAKEFSAYPSGRYPADGSYNGERFRQEFLLPALLSARNGGVSRVEIDIDGVRTFGSSFLEEAFAGLVRKGLFSKQDLADYLVVTCSKPHLAIFRDSIWNYIDEAKPEPIDAVHA